MSAPQIKFYKRAWFRTVAIIIGAFLIWILVIAPYKYIKEGRGFSKEYAERYMDEYDDETVSDDLENNRIEEDPTLKARRDDILDLFSLFRTKPCDAAMRRMYIAEITDFIGDVADSPRPPSALKEGAYEVSMTGSIATDVSEHFNQPVLDTFTEALATGMLLQEDLPGHFLYMDKYKVYLTGLETYRNEVGNGQLDCGR